MVSGSDFPLNQSMDRPPLLAPQLPDLPPLPSEERRYEEARRGCSAKGQPWDPEKYMAYMGSMGFNSDL